MVKKLSNLLLSTLLILHACAPQTSEKRVHAQMFLKVPLDTTGAIECFAEGKHYGILPVTEQTFYSGEDSFHKMHHHGFALENKWMAYRLYFDKRQIVDIYAKRTPQLEIAQSLWYPDDEQLAAGFGDDILKVGSTIGVGSVRPYSKEKGRLLNMDKFESRTQRIVELTNDKAVAEIEVRGLEMENDTVTLITRYTVFADRRGVFCEVFCSDSLTSLVTGVQYIGEPLTTEKRLNDNLILASWGTAWPVNDTIKYAKETTGIAVSIPDKYVTEVFTDNLQHIANLRLIRMPLSDITKQCADRSVYTYYCNFNLTATGLKENNPPAHSAEEFFANISDKNMW